MRDTKVVLVDGNSRRRSVLASFLEKRGFAVETADGLPDPAGPGPEAGPPFVLVLSLPDPSGPPLAALRRWKAERSSVPVVGLVPAESAEAMLPFLESGLLDQIAAPGSPAAVYSAVRAEAVRAGLSRAAESFRRDLRRVKKERLGDSRRAAELEEIYETTLENFMTALDMRDVETFGHSKTVARYSQVLAEALGICDPKTLDNIRRGALLHDAGKIAIPDAILKKPGPLSPAEWEKVRRHPAMGYGLIKDIKLVPEVGHIILCHHERYDGTGYPRGLKREAIPLEARIFAVADTLDAITSHRPYRRPTDFPSARGEIVRNSGGQFDPRVVEAFAAMDLSVWEKIRFQTTRIIPVIESDAPAAAKK